LCLPDAVGVTSLARGPPVTAGWTAPLQRPTREVDVTDPDIPSDVPDADRAEQETPLDPADEAEIPLGPVGAREADEADVLEQETDVPLDDDEPS
jgi:hypothetical protein